MSWQFQLGRILALYPKSCRITLTQGIHFMTRMNSGTETLYHFLESRNVTITRRSIEPWPKYTNSLFVPFRSCHRQISQRLESLEFLDKVSGCMRLDHVTFSKSHNARDKLKTKLAFIKLFALVREVDTLIRLCRLTFCTGTDREVRELLLSLVLHTVSGCVC